MHTFGKSAVLSVVFLVGALIAANADPQYPRSPDPRLLAVPSMAPQAVAPPHPANWYFDPYTNGGAPCPQGIEGNGPKCAVLIPPSDNSTR
jgi:hypothetical protein